MTASVCNREILRDLMQQLLTPITVHAVEQDRMLSNTAREKNEITVLFFPYSLKLMITEGVLIWLYRRTEHFFQLKIRETIQKHHNSVRTCLFKLHLISKLDATRVRESEKPNKM